MLEKTLKLFRDAKLRSKLILSYLILVLLPILLIGYFLIDRTKDAVTEQTDSINQISFEQLKNNIYNQLQTYISFSANAFKEDNIIQYLTTKLEDDFTDLDRYIEYSKFRERYLLKFGSTKENADVKFFTSNHSILNDDNYVFYIDDNIKKQSWYLDAIAHYGADSISLDYSETGNQFFISMSRIIRYTNSMNSNDFTNILKINISENYIFKLMENEGKNKKIYLLDDNNNIISSTDRKNIGKNISNVGTFNEITMEKYPSNQIQRRIIDNESCVINIGYYYDKSAIDGWKVVSIVTTGILENKINEIVKYSLIVCSIIIMITIILVFLFSNTLTKRLRLLARNMGKISEGNFQVLVSSNSKDEIGELTNGFTKMINRINSLIEEVYKAEVHVKDLIIKKKEAEIHALQSQIKPHFLFNTMESIKMNLLKKKDTETANIVQSFSKLLRKSIDWTNDIISIRQELDLVETYLKIQKYRYREKLNYVFEVDEDLWEYSIPKFSLQPIVENAIFHGIEMKEEDGTVRIIVKKLEKEIEILINDDGNGMTLERLEQVRQRLLSEDANSESESIGLINVNQRIKLHFGEEYGITINSTYGSSTTVEIKLPLE